MGIDKLIEWSANYGLGVVLSILGAICFFKLLIFVLKENSKREDRLAGIIEQHLKALEAGHIQTQQLLMAHDQRAVESSKQIAEALKYQREEHKEMIDSLRQIAQDLSRITVR